ncbi:MAG: hypothetical protein ACFE8M_07330 [Candidatus Hermodarchaeota archaeon]
MSFLKANKSYRTEMAKIMIPYSKFYKLNQNNDLYSGNEQIPFKDRHPLFKSLMRVEFEEAMIDFLKSIK